MSRSEKNRIILVGPMGAGKSSIGKSLALLTQKPFIDVDEEIVRTTLKSIPEIFAESGESGFRKIETEVLKNCLKYDAVIATGGGIVTSNENRQLIKNNGFVVYLYASVDTQYLRTKNDSNRPMIAVEDPRSRLNEIFTRRKPLYEEVQDCLVDTNIQTIKQCVEQIKSEIRK
ncbi:shikimate kinase [Succinivibrio sp.]|uniref:shikimate kinase n=1 Tax=Succinivibrio sp. TaxID=2053619 RepID=UPI0025DEFEED|nr:shikimate kinase [Succinivibrio sp.]MBQ9220026.1 shikimate kinase [Succinivibrio sp.]